LLLGSHLIIFDVGHALETVGTRNTRDDRLEDLLDQIGLETLIGVVRRLSQPQRQGEERKRRGEERVQTFLQ